MDIELILYAILLTVAFVICAYGVRENTDSYDDEVDEFDID